MTLAPSNPASPGARLRYEDALRRYAAERLPEARVSRILSRLRLLTFLPGAASAAWALTRGPMGPFLVAAAVFFVIFAVLVVWHARVEDRIAWLDALSLVNQHAIARIGRDWGTAARRRPSAGSCPEHARGPSIRRRSGPLRTRVAFSMAGPGGDGNGRAPARGMASHARFPRGDRRAAGSRRGACASRSMARTPGRTRPPLGEGTPRGDRSLPGMGRGSTAPRQMAASPATDGARPDRQHLVSSGSLRDRHRRGRALARSSGARPRALVCAVLAHSQVAGSRWWRAARTRAL